VFYILFYLEMKPVGEFRRRTKSSTKSISEDTFNIEGISFYKNENYTILTKKFLNKGKFENNFSIGKKFKNISIFKNNFAMFENFGKTVHF
jgi:hypothetical protein